VSVKSGIRTWRVYVVTDARLSLGRSHADVVRAAVAGGADAVQLRDKALPGLALYRAAVELRRICREAGVAFIVNDRVDIALAADADGVHVGQDDLPAAEARRLIGPDRILGVSASTLAESQAACAAGADYLGVGPVFEARGTKPDALPPVGLPGLAAICAAVDVPVIAIGGINVSNAPGIAAAGAPGVAVISAVVSAGDIPATVRALKSALTSPAPC
jgi:thiamine-phosphate pyrophosphorylase